MSIAQRNDAPTLAVPSELVDTLREQTLVVLEVNHHYFEDVCAFSPQTQLALAEIYRDAFAVLDAVGWTPDPSPAATIAVPLTDGHLHQLRRRRHDLGRTNLDRLDTRAAITDPTEIAAIDTQITADRIAAQRIDRLFTIAGATPTT